MAEPNFLLFAAEWWISEYSDRNSEARLISSEAGRRLPSGVRADYLEESMTHQHAESQIKVMLLKMHPGDYANIEQAAQLLGYANTEFMRLSAHLVASAVLQGKEEIAHCLVPLFSK